MSFEWVDKLLVDSPLEFRDAWLKASNGGLWQLCCSARNGDSEAESGLQVLHENLHTRKSEFLERLRWFLKEQDIPTDTAEQLFETFLQMVEDFLSNGGRRWANFIADKRVEIPRVELQGLGVHKDVGFSVQLVLELHECVEGSRFLSPHPSCILIPQDSEFRSSIEVVKNWWVTKSGEISLPHQITWRISRNDNSPIEALKGASLSALLAVGVWLLMNDFPSDKTISVSAELLPDGSLNPVSGLPQKLHASNLCIPPLRVLIVSDRQPLPQSLPSDSLQVVQASSVDEAIEIFTTQMCPFVEAKNWVKQTHEGFEILNKPLDWRFYCEPLLTVVLEGKTLALSEWVKEWLGGEKKHWLLVAPSGMGKTTALKFIAHQIASVHRHLLPIYLRAERLVKVLSDDPDMPLPELLERLFRFLSPQPSSEHFEVWLRSGYLVLLVDQLESAASNLDFLDFVDLVTETYLEMPLLMAVRNERLSAFERFKLPTIRLEPLSAQQAQDLLQKLASFLNKPLPTLNLPLDQISPFLLVALLFVEGEVPKGQGQLFLELAKVLLKDLDLPLPLHRTIEILSDLTLTLHNQDRWDEVKFYDTLKAFVANTNLADQIWSSITDSRLIVRSNGYYNFVHTLLLETFRAYALARRWENSIPAPEAVKFLTPLRAILISSLLCEPAIQDFWDWLRRRAESEPKEWAETLAKCLWERDDVPERLGVEIFQKWQDAFQKGESEKQGWDKAVSALPPKIVEGFIFPRLNQLLSSKSFTDNRAAVNFLSLISHNVTLTPAIAKTLAAAFMGEYGSVLKDGIRKIFAQKHQGNALREFVAAITERLESPSPSQRLRAINAFDWLTQSVDLPKDLIPRLSTLLKKLSESDGNVRVREGARKILKRLSE